MNKLLICLLATTALLSGCANTVMSLTDPSDWNVSIHLLDRQCGNPPDSRKWQTFSISTNYVDYKVAGCWTNVPSKSQIVLRYAGKFMMSQQDTTFVYSYEDFDKAATGSTIAVGNAIAQIQRNSPPVTNNNITVNPAPGYGYAPYYNPAPIVNCQRHGNSTTCY